MSLVDLAPTIGARIGSQGFDSDGVDLELGSFDFWRASVGATFRF